MYIIAGILLIALVIVSALTRSIRLLEDILPDQAPTTEEQPAVTATTSD